ncbi:MAG: TMEM14 family protein [Waddliaceae bacterium]
MKFNAIVVLFYGLIVLIGGLIGYLTAGSLASLLAGSLSGALLFASALGLFRTSVLAFFTALAVSGVLAVFFIIRYVMTWKMIPSGRMGIISIAVFLLLLTTKGQGYLRR